MSFEKEFSEFENALTRLSREYEAFLYSERGRLPADARKKLEAMARALSMNRYDSPAERFRYNTIIGRFNVEVERWNRAVRDKEEGRGRFGKYGVSHATSGPNAPDPASVHRAAGLPDDQALFERYREAKKGQGEDVKRLSAEKFLELLARERNRLREKTGEGEWEFDLAIEGNKVKLKAFAKGKKK
jgi:hypothetical protein